MQKVILGVQIDNRFEEVERVQNVFTEHGCIIKTRLGLHQQAEFDDECTKKGLILLELTESCGDKYKELEEKLKTIEGVQVREMIF